MPTLTTTPKGSTFSGKLLLLAILLGILIMLIPYFYVQSQDEDNIREMGSGKNGNHILRTDTSPAYAETVKAANA